jgi:hypothetical protein
MNLDEVVSKLNEHKQRATYGAVAGILGVSPRGLMSGRERDQKHSWVVAASGPHRGGPTGYKSEQIDPDCIRQMREKLDNIIEDSASLSGWLDSFAPVEEILAEQHP